MPRRFIPTRSAHFIAFITEDLTGHIHVCRKSAEECQGQRSGKFSYGELPEDVPKGFCERRFWPFSFCVSVKIVEQVSFARNGLGKQELWHSVVVSAFYVSRRSDLPTLKLSFGSCLACKGVKSL